MVATLLLLVLEFLIGMANNLFVDVPTSHPGAGAADYFSSAFQSVVRAFSSGIVVLVLHVGIGLALFLNAIELLVGVYHEDVSSMCGPRAVCGMTH